MKQMRYPGPLSTNLYLVISERGKQATYNLIDEENHFKHVSYGIKEI
jgi:hypothetical protein